MTSCESSLNKKISFSLSKVPAKNAVTSSKLSVLDDSTSKEAQQASFWEEQAKQRQEGKAPPLVITPVTTKNEDVDAVLALEREAQEFTKDNINLKHFGVIEKEKKPLLLQSRSDEKELPRTEEEQFSNDLSNRPDELAPHDLAYRAVPVHEFGAALLRGMGWKGDDESSTTQQQIKSDSLMTQSRPQRLGLGATPKILTSSINLKKQTASKRHFANSTGPPVPETDQLTSVKAQAEEEAKQEGKHKLQVAESQERQRKLSIGSIVRIPQENEPRRQRRAVVLQTTGVPGLNRIRLQYEADIDEVVLPKEDLELIPYSVLEREPFIYGSKVKVTNANSGVESLPSAKRRRQEDENDRLASEQEWRTEGSADNRKDDRERHSRQRNRNKKEKSPDKEGKRKSRERSSGRRHLDDTFMCNEEKHRPATDSRKENDHITIPQRHWLIPNIRVRIISHKIGNGRYYKQKGVVLDTSQPGAGTVRMDSGQFILENIAEKYLETALPPIKGAVIILKGKNKYQLGRLLERESKTCKGAVQLSEDMNVVSIPLDDIAEWCGPMDEDETS